MKRGFAVVLFPVLFAAAMAGSGSAARVIFVPGTIGTTGGSAGDVAAADLDGDGDVDVVAAWISSVRWYEQRGRAEDPLFIEHTIASPVNFPTGVYVEDLDGDADMDVIVSSSGDNRIGWFENDGGRPAAFQQHVISTQALEARSVHAADIDRDGDIDVLSASRMDDKVSWYESDGGSPPQFTEHVITEDPDGPFGGLQGPADRAWYVGAADLDSDGDPDVLVGSGADEMMWFENSGAVPVAFTLHIAGMGGGRSPAVHADDIDGDGNVDLVAVVGGATVWFKSDGGTPPSFEQFAAGSFVWDAWDVVTGDIDGDGDVDIVAVSSYEDKIIWDENLGGTPTSFREHVITQDPDGWWDRGRAGFADRVISVFVEDLDLDGDQDVLFGAAAGLVGWFENVKIIEGKAKSKRGDD